MRLGSLYYVLGSVRNAGKTPIYEWVNDIDILPDFRLWSLCLCDFSVCVLCISPDWEQIRNIVLEKLQTLLLTCRRSDEQSLNRRLGHCRIQDLARAEVALVSGGHQVLPVSGF